MNSNSRQRTPRSFTAIVPVILRVTFSLVLWTLGAATMNLAAAQTQAKEHRVVQSFSVDRATVEDLQRWVNVHLAPLPLLAAHGRFAAPDDLGPGERGDRHAGHTRLI
jgi:hypothetical protein